MSNQSGQGLVEYILVLFVIIAMIFGAIYQLNSAFERWAHSYFGDYLSCLLETGELPTISGGGGDPGLCNQLYEPFSLANGRPFRELGRGQAAEGGGRRAGGTREQGVRSGGLGGRYTPLKLGGDGFGSGGGRGGRGRGKTDSTYTGSTGISDYGGGYSYTYRPPNAREKKLLDDRFAFQKARDPKQTGRKPTTARKPSNDEGDGRPKRSPMRGGSNNKKKMEAPDSSFTVAGFLRWLVIAALIIALLMVLGGQALQIGKSMRAER